MTDKILGTIPPFSFDGQVVIALPRKWHLDTNKPIEFEVRINEKNQLVLSSMGPLSQDKTNNTTLEVDISE